MLELAGPPVINREDYELRDLSEYTPSLGEHVRAAFGANRVLNPVEQHYNLSRYRELGRVGDTYFTDEMGMEQTIRGTFQESDPRARRLSLDEANAKGEEVGLRFSEPPTQAQFDYLSDLKRAENSRNEILSHAPLLSGRGVIGLTAGIAASLLDPLNIATAYIPVVGQARYARMAATVGRNSARLIKGALEGGVGAGLVTPITYAQAEALQQDYGLTSAFTDIMFGAALGSGLHWAGGRINDLQRRYHYGRVFRYLRENDANMPHPSTFDRRTSRIQEGDNAARHESLSNADRAKVLNAAVKAVESDKVPKIDTLLGSDPKMADISIPDKRFTATVKLRSNLTAADHAVGTQGATIIDMATARRLEATGRPASPEGLFDFLTKRYKKLGQFKLQKVAPAEFGQRVGNALEHPEQRVAIEDSSKTILYTEGASLGAVRHEVERALDEVYNVPPSERGGYRYDSRDLDQMNAHRAAYGQTIDEFPNRATPSTSPREAADLFNREAEPILGAEGPQVSAHIDEVVNREKDVKLDKVISEEEVPALESIVSNIQGRARDLGIMDKVIPAEEREIMIEDATRAGQGDLVRDLFKAGDKAAEDDVKALTVSEAEILMRAGPEKLAEIIKGEKPTETVIKEAADTGLVTRVNAAKDIKFYLKRSKQELDGEGLERAIRAVQNGEDIDVAVNRETQAAKPEAGEPPVRDEEPAPSDDQEVADAKSFLGEDLFDDIIVDATAIIEAEKIDDKRDLVKGEAQIVKEEHAALENTPKARDLFSSVERDEFNEADRDRALRQGDGASEGGAGGGAGGRGAGDTASARLQASVVGRDSETVGGAQPAIERERAAPGGERPAPETTLSYGGWAIPRRVITPDGSVQVGIEPRIVEFTTLAYERAEERVTSFMRAMEFDPGRMLPSNISDTGAPLVYPNPDGTYSVISGRKRSASLAEIYLDETLEFKALQYRERLGPAADGYRNPVLVSVITDLATPAELDALAKASNSERISGLKTAEQYRQDASRIAVMALYKGGDVTSKQNRDFVQIFTKYLTSAEEREAFSKKGKLTSAGIDRLNAAIFSAAYDDTDTLSRMIVSADPNIKSIAHAYRDVAPAFMKLRREIAQGLVREDMDITASMMRAASLAEEMQGKGVKIIDAISKIDALDPVVDRLIRQFYNPQMTKVNSPLRIAGNLQRFIDGAREKLVQREVDTETVAGVDRQAGVDARTGGQIDDAEETLTAADENAGRSSAGSGQAAPQRAPAQSRPDADLGGARRGAEAPARPAAEELARPVSTKTEKIFDQFIADVQKAKESRSVSLAGRKNIGETDEFSFHHFQIMENGEAWGSVAVTYNKLTKQIQVTNIVKGLDPTRDADRVPGGKNALGPSAVRGLLSNLQKEFPDATAVTGIRISGARKQAGVAVDQETVVSLKSDLRSQLEGMKVPEIRAKAKAEGLEVKGRSKEQIIDSYIKAVEGKKPESSISLEAAYLKHLGGKFGNDVEIAELKKEFPNMSLDAFHDMLRDEQRKGALYLSRIDDPSLRSEKAVAAQIPIRNARGDVRDHYHLVTYREKPVVPETKPVPSTLQDFTRASGWASAADRMDALKDDGASLLKRGAFLGKAKVIVERLVKKAGQLQDEILARDLDGAGDTLGDMVDDAARLTELDPRPESNAVTQWVRSAAREVNVADRQAKAIEATPVERPKVVGTPEGAVRTAFYDFLEGGKPLKGSAQLAKELGIDPNQAYLLLDEAESLGWIKLKSNGVYIRVPRERRPLRPDIKFDDPEAMGEVVGFGTREKIASQRQLELEQIDQLSRQLDALHEKLRIAEEADDETAIRSLTDEIDSAESERQRLTMSEEGRFDRSVQDPQLNEINSRRAAANRQLREIKNEIFQMEGPVVDGNNDLPGLDPERFREVRRQQGGEFDKKAPERDAFFDRRLQVLKDRAAALETELDNIGKEYSRRLDEVMNEAAGEAPRGWDRVGELETDAQRMERDLQSSLALQRAITDAARRIKDLPVQIAVVDRLNFEGFGEARAGMSPWTLRDGSKAALIRVARHAAEKATELVNHEIFHALRVIGLFTKLEWRIIKEAAAEAGGISKGRMARYEPYNRMRAEKLDLHPSLDRHFVEDKLIEEWGATDFGKWIEKRSSERETPLGRIYGRIKDFAEDLRQSFANIGRRARGLQEKPSLEQIYRAIEDGSFARRYQEWGLGRAGADNPLSVNRQAGDEFAAFLNEDMRAIAHDDSESIAKATETALTHLAPCAAYHL